MMNLDNERLRLIKIEKQNISKQLLNENNPIKLKMLQNKQQRLREVEMQLLEQLGD